MRLIDPIMLPIILSRPVQGYAGLSWVGGEEREEIEKVHQLLYTSLIILCKPFFRNVPLHSYVVPCRLTSCQLFRCKCKHALWPIVI